MAKEWVQDARNKARAEAHSRAETKKSLGALKQERTELANKLTTVEKARLSAEAGLKSMETQAEDQILRSSCIKLRTQLGWPGKLLRLRRRHLMNVGYRKQRPGWLRRWQKCAGTTGPRFGQKRLTGRGFLLNPSWGALRAFSFLKRFERLQQCSLLLLLYPFLLLSRSPQSKPLLLMFKSQQGQARVRRSHHRPKTLTPRMRLQLRMWTPRLRMLSPSLKMGMLSLKQLIPRRAITKPRHSYKIFSFYFIFLYLYFSFVVLNRCL